ncbi:phage protein NinX family protein [Xenorhabdus griffiniae]|uniref:phage protein NinX family protein n=1 Tax=Xenorhabdus griffiniae TaxID=351672 RepID=UPI000649BCF0|nr:phage protein NinX family protein [Xenorhabdus griffiniae]KLU14712.1 hypothetical protein AAY47_14875 [Xenorhabdus griffiniae]
MKIKTSELTGRALDWAVARVAGLDVIITRFGNMVVRGMPDYSPSTDWAQCGPLIEKYEMDVCPVMGGNYCAGLSIIEGALCPDDYVNIDMHGQTPQIAICRAVVAAQLGAEVEIPDELLEAK